MSARASRLVAPVLLALATLLALAAPAGAHGGGSGDAPPGSIAIANLTHGEMAVVAAHRSDILALAGQQVRTDETFRRLANFAALQRTYCLWGLVPGSVRDEDSPFNECSHAYLAALRALLVHMGEMAPADGARDLIGAIDREMAADAAATVLCRFSGEPFSTSQVIQPRWRDVPFHAPSLLVFGALALACGSGVALIGRVAPGGDRERRP